MLQISLAVPEDAAWLEQHDRHVKPAVLAQSIRDGRIYLARWNEERIGWLRWNLFWDNTPFMNLLYLLEGWRGQGIGTQLVRRWEADMRANGADLVFTSTQADETSQFFYRGLGYEDIGGFRLPGEAYELILYKTI